MPRPTLKLPRKDGPTQQARPPTRELCAPTSSVIVRWPERP